MEYNSTICCKFHAKLTDAIRQKLRFEVKSCSGTAKILLVCRAEDLGFGIWDFPSSEGWLRGGGGGWDFPGHDPAEPGDKPSLDTWGQGLPQILGKKGLKPQGAGKWGFCSCFRESLKGAAP